MGVLILVTPRRYAIVPLAITTCFLPMEAKYVFLGVNLSMLRILILFAVPRIVVRRELSNLRWLRLDSIVLLWAAVRVLTFTLLWRNSAALVNGLGYAYDEIGLYVLFRSLLRTPEDIERAAKLFACVLLPLGIMMCMERISGRNPFHFLGGVPEAPELREGIIRCQGPFGHPILAGTFGAAWLPMFLGLWIRRKQNRLFAVIGFVASTLMTIMSGSSGPVGTYFAGIVGMFLWSIRNQMRAVRWGLVACIIFLHLVMKDPVWFIFAKVNVFSGSTGWHRANLIDQAIRHLGDWWLMGAKNISLWGVWAGDTTNQFIAEGVRGGIFTMLSFTWIIVISFSYLGKSLRTAAKGESRPYQWFIWSMGVCVFSNVVSFMSVAYFDQNIVNWFFIVAAAATIFDHSRKRRFEAAVTSTVHPESAALMPA
jgi:hypothetical protein